MPGTKEVPCLILIVPHGPISTSACNSGALGQCAGDWYLLAQLVLSSARPPGKVWPQAYLGN